MSEVLVTPTKAVCNKVVVVSLIASCFLIYNFIDLIPRVFVLQSENTAPTSTPRHLVPPSQHWMQEQFNNTLDILGYNYSREKDWETCEHPLQTYFFPQLRTVFTGVPKAGCSNWIEALLRAEGALVRPLNSTDVYEVHKISDPYRMAKTRGEVAAKSAEKDVFSFTVVRNPWSRIVSGYRDKLSGEKTQGRGERNKGVRIVEKYRNLTGEEVKSQHLYPTFGEYLQYLLVAKGTHLPKSDIHFTPQHRILCLPQAHYDYIVPLEYAGLLHEEVFKHINTSVHLLGSYDKTSDPRKQSSTLDAKEWFSKVDKSVIEGLYTLYRPDFALLNYSNFTHPDFPLPIQEDGH